MQYTTKLCPAEILAEEYRQNIRRMKTIVLDTLLHFCFTNYTK